MSLALCIGGGAALVMVALGCLFGDRSMIALSLVILLVLISCL